MIPGWRQVPFNLSGVCEQTGLTTDVKNTRMCSTTRERESRSWQNDYDHRLRESQLNRPQIRTHAAVVLPIFLLRSYYRETVFSALRQLETAAPGARISGRFYLRVLLGAKNLDR